jgi:AraC-like DNA-binding protein
MHHHVPLSSEWIQATARAGQISAAAPLDVHRDVCEAVADLVSGIPTPSGQVERLLALHIIERTAWDVLRTHVARGLKSHATAHEEFHRIVTIVERTEWSLVPARLRRVTHARDRRLALSIREYLDCHCATKITLPEISLALRTSVRRVTAEFRKAFGLTVHEYLTRRRLAEAIRLLITTDVKVSAVATSVGFRDQTALFRQFSRLLGASPSAVRREGPAALHDFVSRLHPVPASASPHDAA